MTIYVPVWLLNTSAFAFGAFGVCLIIRTVREQRRVAKILRDFHAYTAKSDQRWKELTEKKP